LLSARSLWNRLSISPSNGLNEEDQKNSPRKVSKEEKIHFIFLEGKADEFGEFLEMKRNLYLWKFFSPRAFEFPFHEIRKSQLRWLLLTKVNSRKSKKVNFPFLKGATFVSCCLWKRQNHWRWLLAECQKSVL
jgi:hypothetical protein